MDTTSIKLADAVGATFGRLQVREIKKVPGKREAIAVADCSCGSKEVEVQFGNLRSGSIKSCGCLKRELLLERNYTHGKSKTKVYKTWKHIKERCLNPNCWCFRYYGGRGIGMFLGWREDFLAFARYVGDPPSPDHSIDRIENNGNYEPGNLRWVLSSTQNRNSRQAKMTQEQADEILKLKDEGVRVRDIILRTGQPRHRVEYVVYQGGWK